MSESAGWKGSSTALLLCFTPSCAGSGTSPQSHQHALRQLVKRSSLLIFTKERRLLWVFPSSGCSAHRTSFSLAFCSATAPPHLPGNCPRSPSRGPLRWSPVGSAPSLLLSGESQGPSLPPLGLQLSGTTRAECPSQSPENTTCRPNSGW